MKRGEWQNVQMEMIMNEPGKANGVQRLYVDGKLALELTGVMFQNTPPPTEAFFFSNMFGGRSERPECMVGKNQVSWYGDMRFYSAQ